jgi:hypothetical protein
MFQVVDSILKESKKDRLILLKMALNTINQYKKTDTPRDHGNVSDCAGCRNTQILF